MGHNPYLGPFKVSNQNNTSVTVSLVAKPTIIKTVKLSEVFRYKDNLVPKESISTVPGLTLVPSVSDQKKVSWNSVL